MLILEEEKDIWKKNCLKGGFGCELAGIPAEAYHSCLEVIEVGWILAFFPFSVICLKSWIVNSGCWVFVCHGLWKKNSTNLLSNSNLNFSPCSFLTKFVLFHLCLGKKYLSLFCCLYLEICWVLVVLCWQNFAKHS